jgi:hypothetical protein
MKSLLEYIHEALQPIYEGGAGGHMAHPFDYTDWTANDLIDLVDSLFKGKVENLKEKLDGFNISASMNNNGDVIFIRNNTERNSKDGGILYKDIDARWEGKEQQKKVFTTGARIINQIFPKLGIKYFNPDETHRKIINCECIIEGKTNILPYAKDRVAFHGYKLYELQSNKWVEIDDVEGDVDDIYKAAEGIDEAKPRPNLVIRSLEEGAKFAEKFTKEISKLWTNEGLDNDATIEDWKKVRFKKFAPDWFKNDDDIFNRLCNNDKSVKATLLKKRYPEHQDEISSKLDKEIKGEVVGKIMEPMDNLFLSIGNELIDLLDGFVNSGTKNEVINILKKDLENTVAEVEKSDSVRAKERINRSLQRLQALGNKYNAAEGIVIMHKGRRLKMTGSFAPLNAALGARFDLEK